MKYGIREICEVVLKAKSKMKVGDKIFYKDEPVIYFDSLKTSTMEGAATTVYAQGGRGNSRLLAWEGERTVTFTMEDALISSVGLAILTGANVIDAKNETITVHTTEVTDKITYSADEVAIELEEVPSDKATVYVMLKDGDNISTEPYIATVTSGSKTVKVKNTTKYTADLDPFNVKNPVVLVDYYVDRNSGAQQIEITPDKFGGNFYLEASTLFRDTNGVDMPAEFIIPNCKVQSNFTFTMASSGDPSTFTFTMDAFPDYTRFNQKKKVLSVIQVITEANEEKYTRVATDASTSDELQLDKESAAVDTDIVAAINAINAIAKASADGKEKAVTDARTAFNKLTTAEQILQVYNLEKLLAAEATA